MIPPSAVPRRALPVWSLAFFAAAVLYSTTADRGIQWQDSGWQQLRIITGTIDHPLGLALVHPLHYYIGRAAIHIPGLDPPFAITLVSAIASAVAVANVAAIVLLLTGRLLPVGVAAASLALAHTFWLHATQTESYALVATLLSAEWLCLAHYLRRPRFGLLAGVALFNGLGVATHLLAGLSTPIYAAALAVAVATRRVRPLRAVALAALWLIATTPYSALVVNEALRSGDWAGVLRSALVGDYVSEVLNVSPRPAMLARSAAFVLYNLPNLTLPLAALAVYRSRGRRDAFMRILVWQAAVFALFGLRYGVADQHDFLFPLYMALVVLAGAGLSRVLDEYGGGGDPAAPTPTPARRRRARLVAAAAVAGALWPPLCYAAAYEIASSRGWRLGEIARKPYRDDYRAFLLPWGSGQRHARELNRQLATLIPGGGLVLVEDRMVLVAVECARALGGLPFSTEIHWTHPRDRELRLSEWLGRIRDARARGLPVLLIPRDRDQPPDWSGVRWRREGDIYRVESESVEGDMRTPSAHRKSRDTAGSASA